MKPNDQALVKILIAAAEKYEAMFGDSFFESKGSLAEFLRTELTEGIHGEGAGLEMRERAMGLLSTAQTDLQDISEYIEEACGRFKIDTLGWELKDVASVIYKAKKEYERCTSG